MYPWLILLAVIAFPVAEAASIIWLAGQIGWWTLAWLAAAFFGGLALIRFERLAFAPRMLFSMQQGESPFRALFTSTRLFMAGGLLMFPGLITDAMALLLLLYPGTWKRPPIARPAANDEIIEGEFRRESEAISEKFPHRDS
jgi:UPF0716 protein FxsA